MSSKINDFLQPRRHVLVEPKLSTYKSMLKPLANSRSCYKLVSTTTDPSISRDQFFADYLPEQGLASSDRTGPVAVNDTLLILANLPGTYSKKDHFTPSRWWAAFMDAAMQNSGFHMYGSVRALALLAIGDAQTVLPRSTTDRKRPSFITESIAKHVFELAAFKDSGHWVTYKGWDLTEQSAARVAQRAAEQGIVTPKGREMPPYELAPDSPDPGRTPAPYTPRIKTSTNSRLYETIMSEPEMAPSVARKPKKANTRNDKHIRAVIALNQENRHAYARAEIVKRHHEIEVLTRSLSRTAADPQADSTSLRPILDEIKAKKSAIAELEASNHYVYISTAPTGVDDRRAALGTRNFDDASLLFDRRPFEPLAIQPQELFPRELERALIYFEPDSDPVPMRKINRLNSEQKAKAFGLFEALVSSVACRPLASMTEILNLIFPQRPINSVVKAVPGLASFADKTPKPDFDTLPKTVLGGADEDACQPLDPADCYQENLDYDLSNVRVRSLSTKTIFDLCVEYQKSDQEHSPTQLFRMLGGTQTTARTGEHRLEWTV